MKRFLTVFSALLLMPCFLSAQEETGDEADRVEIAAPSEAVGNTADGMAETGTKSAASDLPAAQRAAETAQEDSEAAAASVSSSAAKTKKTGKGAALRSAGSRKGGKAVRKQSSAGKNKAVNQAGKFVPPASCRAGIPGVNLSYEEREDGVVFTARGTSSKANLALQEITGYYLPDPGDRRQAGTLETAQDILPVVKRCFNADFSQVYFYYVEGASVKVYMTGDTPETVSQIKTALKNLEIIKKRPVQKTGHKKAKKRNSAADF